MMSNTKTKCKRKTLKIQKPTFMTCWECECIGKETKCDILCDPDEEWNEISTLYGERHGGGKMICPECYNQ